MPFYDSGGLRLHYVRRGATHPAANTIIFQHGIGGDVRQPGRFLDPARLSIPADELPIIHADFRAHGQSGLGPIECLSIRTLANDLARLLDHLELERAIVGGISMGAAAALRLAVEHPERCRALVLSRPAWADGPMSAVAREALALIADLLTAEDWQASALRSFEQSDVLRDVAERCPDAAKSLRGHIEGALARPETREAAVARLQRLSVSAGLDDVHALRGVSCPVLVLATHGDAIHPFECARRLARSLPNSYLVPLAPKSPIDDSPHLTEVDRLIGEFLRTVLHGRGAMVRGQDAVGRAARA
jgi:pimeloyl-ACP methyl ester carboxylesterase